MRKKSN